MYPQNSFCPVSTSRPVSAYSIPRSVLLHESLHGEGLGFDLRSPSQVSRLSENLKDPLGHKPFRVLALPPLNGCLQQHLHVFEEEIQYKLASICLRSPNHEGTQ